MKISNKIILALGAVACAGLVFSAAGQADEEIVEEAVVGTTGSYGTTETVIISADTPMFSHKFHVIQAGFNCDACHPEPFQKKRGVAEATGNYTMKSLEEGKYCGICHNGNIAFGVVEPQTCVICHGNDIEQPKTIIFDQPVKAVVFNHTMHTKDIGLSCDDCHNKIFKMQLGNAESYSDQFVMKALYKGKYCGACHNGDDAFASDTQCATCHIGVLGYNRLFGDKSNKKGHGEH